MMLANFIFFQSEFSLRHLHSFLVHFPIAYSFLVNLCLILLIIDKSTLTTRTFKYLTIMFMASLIFTNLAGRMTAEKIGLRIDDPVWVTENNEVGSLILSHRSWGNVTTFFWFILSSLLICLDRTGRLKKRMTYLMALLSFIGTGMIIKTGLIGSTIGQ